MRAIEIAGAPDTDSETTIAFLLRSRGKQLVIWFRSHKRQPTLLSTADGN
jgi:hypothetical protein